MGTVTQKSKAYICAGGLWLNTAAVYPDGVAVPITATIAPGSGNAVLLTVSDGTRSESFTVTPLEFGASDYRIHEEIFAQSQLLSAGSWFSQQVPPPGRYHFTTIDRGYRPFVPERV